MPYKIWIESLGCAKNQVDSEVMLGFLRAQGYLVAERPEQADVVIVNTCGFIESAIEESIDAVLAMTQLKQHGACKGIIVAGCLYQRFGDNLRSELPEVDVFLGCGGLDKIADACRNALLHSQFSHAGKSDYLYDHTTPRMFLNGVTSVYLKIAEGCDNQCRYCTIPSIRGRYRSRSIHSVIKEARDLLKQGAKELNLVAQDTTYFGFPESGEECLTGLLRELDRIRMKKWVRVLYAHPARVTHAVARAIEDSRSVVHYLDMPIQHITDDILKAMGRKGNASDIYRAIGILRDEIPDLALRTTVMVGFPGETDKHFEQLLRFVREMEFERLGVFKYSREPGTPAARLRRQIPEQVKEDRYETLMRVQSSISKKLNQRLIGQKMEVLVEGFDSPNTLTGRTYRDAPEVDGNVLIPYKGPSPPIGEFIQVEISNADIYDLEGRML
ncbi:MAG: 30S ribosomal protein S12 methylthiotransferase RimO [Candidatus Abyssubacteria bacterium]